MADEANNFSSSVHGTKDALSMSNKIDLRPSCGRGNVIDANDAGSVCLANLGET